MNGEVIISVTSTTTFGYLQGVINEETVLMTVIPDIIDEEVRNTAIASWEV